MSFLNLPHNLIYSVMCKMSNVTLCRLRQTTRLDNLAQDWGKMLSNRPIKEEFNVHFTVKETMKEHEATIKINYGGNSGGLFEIEGEIERKVSAIAISHLQIDISYFCFKTMNKIKETLRKMQRICDTVTLIGDFIIDDFIEIVDSLKVRKSLSVERKDFVEEAVSALKTTGNSSKVKVTVPFHTNKGFQAEGFLESVKWFNSYVFQSSTTGFGMTTAQFWTILWDAHRFVNLGYLRHIRCNYKVERHEIPKTWPLELKESENLPFELLFVPSLMSRFLCDWGKNSASIRKLKLKSSKCAILDETVIPTLGATYVEVDISFINDYEDEILDSILRISKISLDSEQRRSYLMGTKSERMSILNHEYQKMSEAMKKEE